MVVVWNLWQIYVPQKQCLIYLNDLNMQLAKAWTAANKKSIIWKSELSN